MCILMGAEIWGGKYRNMRYGQRNANLHSEKSARVAEVKVGEWAKYEEKMDRRVY
jgi:hypothetical protein